MTNVLAITAILLGGALLGLGAALLKKGVLPRFLGEFWGRFRQCHIFTLVQLVGQPAFWGSCALFAMGGWLICAGGIVLLPIEVPLYIAVGALLGICAGWLANKTMRGGSYSLPSDAPALTLVTSNPQVASEFAVFERGFQKVYACLHRNLMRPFGKTKTWFAIPGSKYPAAYLWDSCFISGAWRLVDVQVAQEILRPFLDLQNPVGLCPKHVLFGTYPAYDITNPPLLAFAFARAAEMTGDYSLAASYFPKLQAFEKYIEAHRADQGLFKWAHSYESGIDNSPRFTDASEREKYDLRTLWAIDFSTWVVLHYQAMADIARHAPDQLAHSENTAQEYHEKAKALLQGIVGHLWDEASGLFYDYDYSKQVFTKIATIFSLFPLATGNLPAPVVTRLLQHVQDPTRFNTPIPLPTVARSDPLFAKDTWRGPVWVNTAYIVLRGLRAHNQDSLAGKLAYRLVKGVYETAANEGSFYEFYDPDQPHLTQLSRKKGNLGKQLTLGGKPVHNFCGWTALVNSILIENVIGYSRQMGKVSFTPHLPDHWLGGNLTLMMPQFKEVVSMSTMATGEIEVKIKNIRDVSVQVTYRGRNHAPLAPD